MAHQQRAARPVELPSRELSDGRQDSRQDDRPCAYTHAFPRRPASVAAARHRVHSALRGRDLPAELCDMAELVMSELVTNAVLRTRSSVVRCTTRIFARGVRVEVRDDDPAAGGPLTEHEMFLVDKVARAWGSTPNGNGRGRTVWANIALTERTPERTPGRAER